VSSQVPSGAIAYQLEPQLTADEFIEVLRNSTLAERRPVDDRARIESMLRQADIILTARDERGKIVGVARALSDFSYATYLSDLAVDQAFQGRGIGRELIRQTRLAGGEQALLVLLAAPKSRSYYPHIGMKPHESCWLIERSR
jgi:ribosomal protein S18 acetylase RimI-like enzyme